VSGENLNLLGFLAKNFLVFFPLAINSVEVLLYFFSVLLQMGRILYYPTKEK